MVLSAHHDQLDLVLGCYKVSFVASTTSPHLLSSRDIQTSLGGGAVPTTIHFRKEILNSIFLHLGDSSFNRPDPHFLHVHFNVKSPSELTNYKPTALLGTGMHRYLWLDTLYVRTSRALSTFR